MSRGWLAVVVVCFCLVYAVIRYIGFGTVSPQQLPMFISNKAIALAGLILLVVSRWGNVERRREFGMLGLGLVVVHVLLSLSMFTPAYFGKFFLSNGRMTWQAEASLLAGALATLVLCRLFLTNQNHGNHHRVLARWWGRGLLALVGMHVALMGYPGWLKPSQWHGGLPPITLLSIFAVLLGLCWRRGVNK